MKRKMYNKFRNFIQYVYMLTFITYLYLAIFMSKFITKEELKPILVVVFITGALSIGKFIYYCRKKSNRRKLYREVIDILVSENDRGI